MKTVIYSKYNTHRAPKYRIRTSIIEDGSKKYVIKAPVGSFSKGHIDRMKNNYEKLKKSYVSIIPVKYQEENDGLLFEYIKGKPLDTYIDYENDSIEEIVSKTKRILKIVLNYKPECIKNGRVCPANIDSIFSNFVQKGKTIYLLDYEWVEDEPVELRYLEYRAVFYSYIENHAVISERIEINDFLSLFGYGERDRIRYNRMENLFQGEVHGKRQFYDYSKNYLKTDRAIQFTGIETESDFALKGKDEELRIKDTEIANLMNQVVKRDQSILGISYENEENKRKLAVVKRSIKNPFFAVYKVGVLVGKWIFRRNNASLYRSHKAEIEEKKRDCILEYEPYIESLEKTYERDSEFSYNPLISVLCPVYNVADKYLLPCIESVKNQTYKNWELILVDDASPMESVRKTLNSLEGTDSRIKIYYAEKNGGISKTTNIALSHAKGEFIALLDCDDLLSDNALYENVKLLNENPDLDLIYSDEDKVDEDGNNRQYPNFKPEYSPDTLVSMMYICHLSLYRKNIVEEIGGLRSEMDGSQDHDLALRFTERTKRIAHIPKILYHWRMRAESTAGNADAKPYTVAAGVRAKEDMLRRNNISGRVEMIPGTNVSKVIYDPVGFPLVSVVIPSKDNPKLLGGILNGLVNRTNYKELEIIVVDNGSSQENEIIARSLCAQYDAVYIYNKEEFNFSHMCNTGAKEATGEFLLFLNDDIEVIGDEWLSRMVGHGLLPHVGAVGAKLLYPRSSLIQHVGVCNIKTGPSHILHMHDDRGIYGYLSNRSEINVLSVTGACLLVKKEKFDKVGGFDENFPVAYNDIDLCIKLYEAGYYNVIRNDAVLIHHESVTRGIDERNDKKMKRLIGEREKLYEAHPDFREKDPFYSMGLNQIYPDFSVDMKLWNSDPRNERIPSFGKHRHYKKIEIKSKGMFIELLGHFVDLNSDNLKDINILFEGETTSVLCDTKKVYKEDLDIKYPHVRYAGFSGFDTLVNLEKLPEEDLKVFIVKDGEKYETSETLKRAKPKYSFPIEPMFSFVIPLYKTDEKCLRELMNSLLAQTYKGFEICLADGSDGAYAERIQAIVSEYKLIFPNISYAHLDENKGIAENTNEAISFSKGDYIVFCDHDDVIPEFSLMEFVEEINRYPETDVIYSDQDFLSADGKMVYNLLEKPDYNIDFLRSGNYISHLFAIKRSLLDKIGYLSSEYDGAQDFDLTLRAVEKAERIGHIKKSLYHWRVFETSTAADPSTKLYAYENGKKAIEDHLKRLDIPASVTITENFGKYRVDYHYKEDCLVMIEENLESLSPDALEHMIGIASRPDVGYVGGKIITGDDKIYHAGIHIVDGKEVYDYQGEDASILGSLERIAAEMDVDAVSERCMVVKRSVYEKYPDCAKAKAAGLLNVYTGFAVFKESE